MANNLASTRAAPAAPRASGPGSFQRVPLTDRVNVEPPILNGMTSSEAKLVGLGSLAIWGLIGAVVSIALGMWQLMLVFGVLLPASTVWFSSTRLASIKRNRPDGYYRQALHRWAVLRSLAKPRFLTHAGRWSIGRRLAWLPGTDPRSRASGRKA